MIHRRLRFAAVLSIVFSLLSLAEEAPATDSTYVIHVSVDGLRGDLLAAMLDRGPDAGLPTFQRLRVEGAATFNARTDYSHTNTLPNHTCMLTGRPVERPAGRPSSLHHGYVWNSKPKRGETLHGRGNPDVPYIASVFDVVHDAGLSTALYASKKKFLLFDRSWDAAHGAPDTTGADDGPDKIDRYVYASGGSPDNAASLNDSLLADLRSNPARYSFVHYLDPDAAGHDFGWGSPGWEQSVRAVDGYLGRVLACIEQDPRLAGRTVVIVTADHGGEAGGHGDPEKPGDYTVPFLVWGAGVTAGGDLYVLNATTRVEPGRGRPSYTAAPQPIRNAESGNLALMLLGLGPVPGSSIDARQDLVVGAPGGTTGAHPSVK